MALVTTTTLGEYGGLPGFFLTFHGSPSLSAAFLALAAYETSSFILSGLPGALAFLVLLPLAEPALRPGFGPGLRPALRPGFGPGLRPGFGPGLRPALRPGFGPGLRPGFGPGLRPALRPGFGPGLRPGFGPGLRPALRPGFGPGLRPGFGPGLRPALRPGFGPGLRPGFGPGLRPALRPGFGPGLRPGFGPGLRPDLVPDAFEPELDARPSLAKTTVRMYASMRLRRTVVVFMARPMVGNLLTVFCLMFLASGGFFLTNFAAYSGIAGKAIAGLGITDAAALH